MNKYLVRSKLGDRSFSREIDATDYQIKILSQTGVKSEVLLACKSCEKYTITNQDGDCRYCGETKLKS